MVIGEKKLCCMTFTVVCLFFFSFNIMLNEIVIFFNLGTVAPVGVKVQNMIN